MTPRFDLPEPLITARLRLRRIADTDAAAVHRWRSDPAATRYLPYGPQRMDQVQSSLGLQSKTVSLERDGDRLVLAVERRDDQQVIGELHLVLKHAADRGYEVGWVFSPRVAGQGYATEAATELVAAAFARGGAHRVVAELDPRNTASAQLCARLGMRQEAHFVKDYRTDGGWADTAIWAILDDEWRGAPRAG